MNMPASTRKPCISLTSKAVVSEFSENNHHLYFALANSNYCLVDIEHGKNLYESDQIHHGRIGSLRCKDNLLITGGNDSLVKIFDTRSHTLAHTFQSIDFFI